MATSSCNSPDPTGNPDITGIGVRSSVYIQSLLVVVISYTEQQRGEGHKDLKSIWRVQLFNYVAFTLALVSLAAKDKLSSFNKLAALHLTYMYLVSTLTGSLLVHPTYFNGPSATRHGSNNITVTTVRVLGGLLPAVVCAWSGGPPNCMNLQEIEDIRWIILFAIQVGQRTAYALTLAFSLVVLLLHIIFSLDAVSKAVQHFMDGISCVFCPTILDHQSKWMNNLVFAAFFIYWLEVVVGIELSLIVNFGPDVRTQNNWGFGQILSFVLLYPILEALWWNVMSPTLVSTNRRSSIDADETDLPTSIKWQPPSYPLSTPFNESEPSFPRAYFPSAVSLASTIGPPEDKNRNGQFQQSHILPRPAEGTNPS